MRLAIFGLLFIGLLIMGCCGTSTPSANCPYGTYGSSCTELCDKSQGTQFDGGPNCFSDCMDMVRAQELGDATTCCKENGRQQCNRYCANMAAQLKAKYGSVVDPAEESDTMEGCMAECGGFETIGVDLDRTCAVLDLSNLMAD